LLHLHLEAVELGAVLVKTVEMCINERLRNPYTSWSEFNAESPEIDLHLTLSQRFQVGQGGGEFVPSVSSLIEPNDSRRLLALDPSRLGDEQEELREELRD
jgi:hypothetical protein